MLSFKDMENIHFSNSKFDRFAPKHTFLNSVQIKAIDQKNVLDSESIVSKLVKKHLKKKIEEKIRKNKKLEDREKRFLENEGITNSEQKNLPEMIRKHNYVFNLEKYMKARERDKEQKTRAQLKREEIMKRNTIKQQEKGIPEEKPLNLNNSSKYDDLLKKTMQKTSQELYSRNMNIMNMIRTKVEGEFMKKSEQIEKLNFKSYVRKGNSHKRRISLLHKQCL